MLEQSGCLPSTLGQQSELQFLFIQSNDFVGAVPHQLSAMTSLW